MQCIILDGGLPTVKFGQIRYSIKAGPDGKKEFSHGPGPQAKAFLLYLSVDLQNRSFKTVDRKSFKYSGGSYLHKA
jgi:hypothetical protein